MPGWRQAQYAYQRVGAVFRPTNCPNTPNQHHTRRKHNKTKHVKVYAKTLGSHSQHPYPPFPGKSSLPTTKKKKTALPDRLRYSERVARDDKGDAAAVTVTSTGVMPSGAGTKTSPASPAPFTPPSSATLVFTSAPGPTCSLEGEAMLPAGFCLHVAGGGGASFSAAAAATATAPAAPTSPSTAIAAAVVKRSSDGPRR